MHDCKECGKPSAFPHRSGVCPECRTLPLLGFSPDTGTFAAPEPNPSPKWHNSRLSDNWHELERVVGAARMPRAVVRPARSPDRRPSVRAVEHGKGYYGVVMPTNEPGIVCKLTTDQHEACLAELLLREREPPPGVVRYHAIARVSGPRHGRPTWALWREEASRVGASRASGFREDLGTLYALGRHAEEAWRALRREGGMRMRSEVLAWADSLRDVASPRPGAPARLASAAFVREVGRSGPAPRLGYAVAACRSLARRMAAGRAGGLVGAAFLWALDRGLLLSDMHRDNVGLVGRAGGRYVITDPGVVLWLAEGLPPSTDSVGTGPVEWRSWGSSPG